MTIGLAISKSMAVRTTQKKKLHANSVSNVFIENSERLDSSPSLYHSLLRLASNKRNIVVSFVCYSVVTYHKSLNSASYLHLLAFVSVLFIEKIQ